MHAIKKMKGQFKLQFNFSSISPLKKEGGMSMRD